MSDRTKIAVSILSITIIIVCFLQVFPKYKQLQKSNVIISEKNINATEEKNTSEQTKVTHSNGTPDESGATEVDYSATQEYVDFNNRILAVQERTKLINDKLTNDLSDITSYVFIRITKISGDPEDEKSVEECKQYMTDDFFAKFKQMKFEQGSYIVDDIKFTDFDKDDITSYVLTRSTDKNYFFVTYSFDKEKITLSVTYRRLLQRSDQPCHYDQQLKILLKK